MNQNDARRYTIKPNDAYLLYTGISSHQEQILMGLSCPNLVAFHFDLDGNLLRHSQRSVPFFEAAVPPYQIHDERIPPLIEAWQKEMGLRLANIEVKKFFSPEHFIGIEDYPSHFHEILSDPTADDQEKADIQEDRELWDQSGQFVLHWGNDYWLDESGEIVAS